MKVVLDSYIIIDVLRPNPDYETDANKVFILIWQNKITPYICASSLTDIFYILRKVQGAEKAKETIANLITAANIIPLAESDCTNALALPMSDFEDAIIVESASKISADFIVSRDEKLIKTKTEIKVITPKQLIELIN